MRFFFQEKKLKVLLNSLSKIFSKEIVSRKLASIYRKSIIKFTIILHVNYLMIPLLKGSRACRAFATLKPLMDGIMKWLSGAVLKGAI